MNVDCEVTTVPQLETSLFSESDESDCTTSERFSSESKNISNWDNYLSLVNCKNLEKDQLYGVLTIRNWIISADDGFLTKNFPELRKRVIQKILEIIYSPEEGDVSVPVSTKLHESLIWLYFKTPKLWIHPLKWMVYAFVYGGFHFDITDKSITEERILDGIDKSTYSKGIIENTLRLLSIISEEFTSTRLPHSVKCIITQDIQSDEDLVQKILMQFLGRAKHEEVCAFAMHTCGLWISSFVTSSSSAIGYVHLIHAVYTSMQYSACLYSAGINCLINIFESDGGGLNSDWESVALLDFHICQLVKFKSTLQELVELYSVNLQKCGRRNELKSYDPLAKTLLLFSILTEKQMDYLMHRLTQYITHAQNATGAIHEFFNMLLLMFSLPGSYPYDEDVSDIALRIWLNAQEVSISSSPMITSTTGTNNACCSSSTTTWTTIISPVNPNASHIREDIIKLIHKEFNQLAFNKSHYPKDINRYLNVWKSEDRCRWLKFRQDLGECFLAAFRYLNITDWYMHASYQFSWIVNNCTNAELLVNWQEIEALLFVMLSISEHVLYENASGVMVLKEFAKSVSISLMKFMNKIKQLIAYYYAINDTIGENTTFQWGNQKFLSPEIYVIHSQCLILFKTLLLCIEKYYTVICSELRSSGQNELECLHIIVNILLSTIGVEAYKDEVVSLRHSALQILQTSLEHKPFSLQSSISLIASTLEHFYSRSRPLDPTSCDLLFYCSGMLLRLSENESSTLLSLRNIISENLQTFVELCTAGQNFTKLPQVCVSTSPKSTHIENSTFDKFDRIATVMQIFTQMFRGYTAVENETTTHRPVGEEMLSILNKMYFYLKRSLEVACPHIPKHFRQYHKLLRITLRIFTQVYESGDNEGIKTVTSDLVRCILLTFNYLLNNYNDDIFSDAVLKAIQCFIEWLFNNYRENVIGQGAVFLYYAYTLLSLVYERLDQFLCKQAKQMDNKDVLIFNVSIGYTLADCIHHPISPVIMGFTAQLITSEIEAVSRFLRSIVNFDFLKETAALHHKDIFDVIRRNLDIEKATKFLDITMTLAFSGISVPEWTTVESCLRLICDLLALLNKKKHANEAYISHRYTISDKFLFEINVCLLLVLAKGGGLPERLTTKYAELYTSLAKLSPDKQFALLNHILVGDSTTSTTTTTTFNCEGQIPHCSRLIEIVRQSIPQSINIAERKSFITTVSRPSMSMQRIRQSISTFVHLLSQRK